ncbi:LysR substrate-binding domain-containing protein [Fulvimarina sp. MAC3]|uniref:LysR substrate-binding domain-containing protein n=1 Tax=Fulvimarina sp. MAC3 TaxID=3148887 RepID=UPI0031FCC8D7
MALRGTIPSLASLATFEAAARLGGFTKAAEELGVTQAAVSRQIKLLEGELHNTLFVRGHRRVDLTPAGQILARAVSLSFDAMAEAITQIRQPALTGTVTIGATHAVSHFWLLPRLKAFREANPAIKLRVLSQDNHFDLRSDDVDLVIRFGLPPFRDGLTVGSIADEVFPAASPAFAEELGENFSAQRLADIPLITNEIPDATWLSWRQWHADAGLGRFSEASTLRFSQYNDAVYAAIAGEGVVLGWRLLLSEVLASGRLVQIGGRTVRSAALYNVVIASRKTDDLTVQAAARWIAERLEMSKETPVP